MQEKLRVRERMECGGLTRVPECKREKESDRGNI